MEVSRLFVVVPITLFFLAAGFSFFSLNWHSHPMTYIIGSGLIANPFVVLAAGHVYIANGLRSRLFLLGGNILAAPAVLVVAFLLRWFQPGWAGVLFFSLLLGCFSALYTVGARLLRDKPNGSNAQLDTDATRRST